MNTKEDILHCLLENKDILAALGVVSLGLFGSFVRGEQRPDSDLDILIELERPPRISLLGLVELEQYLSDLFGIKVDVAIKSNLRKRIGSRILSEAAPI